MSEIWFGTRGPHNARVVVVGESWGSQEARMKLPFVGQSGQELERMLGEANIDPHEVFFTNVFAKQPPGNKVHRLFYTTKEAKGLRSYKGLYPTEFLIAEHERLLAQINEVNPDVIIGCGNYALWALTDSCFSIGNLDGYKVPTGIGKWRGSQLYATTGHKFVPTYHPAGIMRQWPWRAPAMNDLRMRVGSVFDGTWQEPVWRFIVEPQLNTVNLWLQYWINEMSRGKELKLAVDIETAAGHIACIGLAADRREAICIPFIDADKNGSYWSTIDEYHVRKLLQELLMHPNVRIIGQNFNYDLQYIARELQILPKLWFDTMVAQHVLFPGTPKGLDYLSSLYCEFHRYWKDEGKVWERKLPQQQLWHYNCTDCVRDFEVHEVQERLITGLQLRDQFDEQMVFNRIALDLMLRGAPIDTQRRMQYAMQLSDAIRVREEWLENSLSPAVAPREKTPWYRSNKQQQEIFYGRLSIKPVINRKTGRPTVDDAALEVIKKREPALWLHITTLQELRSLAIFFTNFVLAKLDPPNILRCEFKSTGAETYRWASGTNAFGGGTNLQNIPKGTEE